MSDFFIHLYFIVASLIYFGMRTQML